jgi:two-component system cell cycle sensor histidine kinase/response regulator CckA
MPSKLDKKARALTLPAFAEDDRRDQMNPYRILHLEDNPVDAMVILSHLESSDLDVEILQLETRAAYLSALENESFTLILADYTLPFFDGLSALRIAREKRPDTPFIFISGTIGDDLAVETLKNGATDYVLKSCLGRLVPVITRAIKESEERIARRQAKKALREAEEQIRFTVERIPAVVWTTDRELRFTSIHGAGLVSEKWDAGMIGQSLVNPFASQDNIVRVKEHLTALAGNKVAYDVRVDGKDYQAHVAPLTSGDGEIIGCIGLAVDVTERKALEMQMRHAQKMEAVGRLAGGLAHDFNNLLTIITGYSDLTLLRLGPNDPLRSNIDQVNAACDRATGLVRHLLAFSRKQILKTEVLNLNNTVSEMNRMLPPLIGENMELVIELYPDLWQVKADSGQIEQIVANLAVNARDAMPFGGEFTIRTSNIVLDEEIVGGYESVQSGPYVLLTMSDTGHGMNHETLRRIFEPFFTTKEVGKGTGLGLSTVYGIVKQSGGYVSVESEVGRGTTFKIYLPRVDEEVGRIETSPRPSGLLPGEETVLLVEDDDQVRSIAAMALEMSGYDVLTAANGEEALLLSERFNSRIDLLLTDMVMPRMGGQELSHRLLKLRPGTRVLYMSGYSENAISQRGVIEGTVFIEKPFSPEALTRRIREVLDTPRDQNSPAGA